MAAHSGQGSSQPAALQEIAYLHEPYWEAGEADWVKSLLLFFDGVAVLIPDYMRERVLTMDPPLAHPLSDLGLLHRLSPEAIINRSIAEELTDLLDRLIQIGTFDSLPSDAPMVELSVSRLGGYGSYEMAGYVIEELRERGLAGESQDGVSIPLHWAVRRLVLALLPQLIKTAVERDGFALQPTVTRPQFVDALVDVLEQPILPSSASVVSTDLEQFALDLSAIPLDEVLDFRNQHGNEYRAYARDVRRFIREVTPLPEAGREQAIADRRDELRDRATQLDTLAKKSWHKRAGTLLLGAAGSTAAFASGNPAGGAVSGVNALYGLGRAVDAGSAYTYLFRVESELSGRSGGRRRRGT